MKKRFKIFLGFAISATCLWLTLRNFDFSELRSALTNASPLWLLPATLMYFGGFILRTRRWQVILKPIGETTLIRLFPVLTFGFFLNNILPARAGEFARAYAGSKLMKTNTSACLGTIVLERLSDILGLLFLMCIASRILNTASFPIMKFGLIFVIGLMGIAGLLLIAQKNKSKKGTDLSLLDKGISFIKKFIQGFNGLKSPKTAFTIVALAIFIWLIEAVTTMAISRAFNLHLTFFQAAALIVGTSVGTMIPAAPGYIGTYEFFAHKTMVLMGFPSGPALAFVLVLHFFQLAMISLLGLPYFFKFGVPSKTNTLATTP